MKLTNLNIDRLKIVSALRQTGSFSKTAALLHLTPSAVNQGLTAIENQMGVKLFIRRGKTIIPTDACLKIDNLFTPFSVNLENVLSTVNSEQKIMSGRLKIFIPTLVGPKLLAKPFLNFLKKHPDVHLMMDNGPAPLALDHIYKNNFDIGICGLKKLIDQNKWCKSLPLLDLTMNLYCSPRYFEENKRLIKSRQFEKLLFMTGISSQFMLDWYFKDILKSKFNSPSKFSTYDMSFTVEAVAQGFGLGLLAKELVADKIEQGKIIEIGTKPLTHPLYFIYQKGKTCRHLEQVFMDETLAYFNTRNTIDK